MTTNLFASLRELKHFGGHQNTGQHIIKIMRNTASHLAQGSHLFTVP